MSCIQTTDRNAVAECSLNRDVGDLLRLVCLLDWTDEGKAALVAAQRFVCAWLRVGEFLNSAST